MSEARTVSVSIARTPREVYDFVRDGHNLASWAFFADVTRDGDGWTVRAGAETGRLVFVPDNELGVLDHDVTFPDVVVHVPIRVLPNEAGSEVLVTTFRRPGVDLEDDVATVEKDLAALKSLLES